jgi:hypothetical protein
MEEELDMLNAPSEVCRAVLDEARVPAIHPFFQ